MNGTSDIERPVRFFLGDEEEYKYNNIDRAVHALKNTHQEQELKVPFIPKPRRPRRPERIDY